MRPRIICHMMTAVDGKITGSFMETDAVDGVNMEYERTNNFYNPQAWLCGRVTTDENFTFYHKPDLDRNASVVPEGDFVAVKDAPMYYVLVDASGRIGWESSDLKYEGRPTAHVIEVLTVKASNAYKDFLRRLNISYIIAGDQNLDCALASEKLHELFGIETLMLSGGGNINGSFLNEGLIDELSLVIAPVTDGSPDTVTLFGRAGCLPEKPPVEFSLLAVEQLSGDGVWLRYSIKK
ncbi:dihydrofolate reductase family protein [Apibacter adventoris]|uniref:5-amino-6-(5-phosphoribosylamino)uracil reductase n=1 Tax=Apibacter adventoris TaxID=1679466 RepID=A0A2S8AEC7_9FLAO|nr:RibD family protein [Apibacter adventoris]PQL93460.1 5-amino-6-(5-phosphoribosylamino)uracil reductase [Apibacter adventoris]